MPEKVVIAGSTHLLRFTLDSVCAMEEQHGVNVFDSKTYFPSPKTSVVLIWGAILAAKPDATLEYIRKGLALADIDEAGSAALRQLMADLPKKAKPDEQPAAGV